MEDTRFLVLFGFKALPGEGSLEEAAMRYFADRLPKMEDGGVVVNDYCWTGPLAAQSSEDDFDGVSIEFVATIIPEADDTDTRSRLDLVNPIMHEALDSSRCQVFRVYFA